MSMLCCACSLITLATQLNVPTENTRYRRTFFGFESCIFQSINMGVASKRKSMTTWTTLSAAPIVSVDQQTAGLAKCPEYALFHMAGGGLHWKEVQNKASSVYPTRRNRKTSLAMRQPLEVTPDIRRRKSAIEILIMPTVVKNKILQKTPS